MTITSSPKSQSQSLTPSAIHSAYTLIKQHVHRTPLPTNQTLNNLASTPQASQSDSQPPANPKFRFFFKCENYQRIGAFKARGAFHALLRLIESMGEDEVKRRGVITHSSGMHSYLSPHLSLSIIPPSKERDKWLG